MLFRQYKWFLQLLFTLPADCERALTNISTVKTMYYTVCRGCFTPSYALSQMKVQRYVNFRLITNQYLQHKRGAIIVISKPTPVVGTDDCIPMSTKSRARDIEKFLKRKRNAVQRRPLSNRFCVKKKITAQNAHVSRQFA